MFQETEIKSIAAAAANKIAAVKSYMKINTFISAYTKEKRAEEKYPDFYPTYRLGIELMQQIRVHAEKGVFPEKLFRKASPNQTEPEFNYAKDVFKQKTLPVGMDFISTVSRGWSDGNWDITYSPDDDTYINSGETLEDYLTNKIKVYGSIENWGKSLLPSIKTVDAMGVIAIKPDLVVDADGTVSSTELNEPQPYYFDCTKVVSEPNEKYYLIDVTDYEAKKLRLKFEFYDTENILSVVQTNDDMKNPKFDVTLIYKHDWGKVPVIQLKGVPKVIDNKVLWQSPLSFAVDILDEVLMDNTNLRIIKNNSAFPTKVMVGRPCKFSRTFGDNKEVSKCIGGHILNLDTHEEEVCSECNGSGLNNRLGPTGVLLLNPGEFTTEGDSNIKFDPLRYVAPSAEIFKMLEESIQLGLENARQILHLKTSNSNVRGTENMTATGMSLDEKAKYAFIKPFSDQMFSVWEFVIDAIGWMRYKENYKKPNITYPNSFDFNTEWDYLYEISEAVKAELPPFVIHTIILKYLKSFFYNEEKTIQAFSLIIEADRLIGIGEMAIAVQMNKGLIADWEVALHNSGITILNDLLRADDKFFEKDFSEQITALKTAAQELTNLNKPAQTDTAGVIAAMLKVPATAAA